MKTVFTTWAILSVFAFLTSCTPSNWILPTEEPTAPIAPAVKKKTTATKETVSSKKQKEIRKTRQTVKKKSTAQSSTPKKKTYTAPQSQVKPKPVVKKTFPYASKIPGKTGFVFNPYNNNMVDVRGLPSGSLVRDPNDSNSEHKFRVP